MVAMRHTLEKTMKQRDTFEYRATIIHDMDKLEIDFEGDAKTNADFAPVSIGSVLEGIANHAIREMGKEALHPILAATLAIQTGLLAGVPEEVAEEVMERMFSQLKSTLKAAREGRVDALIEKARAELRAKRGEDDGPPQTDDVQRERAAQAAAAALRDIFK